MVDLALGGAVLLVAAAEAVGETRRLAVVGVVGGDVTAMTALVCLHVASALDRARVTARTLLRAPTTHAATTVHITDTPHRYSSNLT